MSSILRALKKLESESFYKDETSSLPQEIDTKKALNKRVKGFWLTSRINTILLTAVILIGLALLVLSQRDLFRGESEKEIPPPAPLKREIKGSPRKVPKKTVNVAALSPKVEMKPKGPVDRMEKTSSPPVETKKTTQKEIPVPLTEKTTISRESAEIVPPEAKPPEPPRENPPIAEKQLDISGFRLEAIIWARNSESRFAVINGKIVRAGGSMNGTTVKELGRDHVTLESGGREANLKFRAD